MQVKQIRYVQWSFIKQFMWIFLCLQYIVMLHTTIYSSWKMKTGLETIQFCRLSIDVLSRSLIIFSFKWEASTTNNPSSDYNILENNKNINKHYFQFSLVMSPFL